MKEVIQRSNCPISFCLDFIGDKWSLLIIRDMILEQKTTFGDFLASDEHIATNILTARLKMLESEGFVIKYPLEGKIRSGYCLTPKGIDLVPLITEMLLWGSKYSNTKPLIAIVTAIKKDKNTVNKELTARLTKKYQATQNRSIL